MAESRESSTFDQRRAVSLLQEATRFLQEYSSQGDRTSPTGVSSNVQQPAEAAPSTSRAEPSTSRVLQNFRSIFAPYAQRLSPGACSSRQTSEKRPKKGKWSNFSFKRETWTHEFFCLADRNQTVAPGKGQKERLQDAGLGRKKICFHYKATSGEVKAKLEETFPKLREGGGFDILRRGPTANDLTLIRPPASGYSVPFLRDSAGLGQAIAFIRPLQVNLNTDRVETVEEYGVSCIFLLTKTANFHDHLAM